MQWGDFEFIRKSLQSSVGALCKELDKITISNLFLRSSQPAPGACEISPEANPTVPNLGTGLDRISREAAVWVLCRGVTAQEAGWGCLRPWGYPAVPIEGAVPVGKDWLTCLKLRGTLAQLEKPQLLCWLRIISVTLLLHQCSVRMKIEGLQSPSKNCHGIPHCWKSSWFRSFAALGYDFYVVIPFLPLFSLKKTDAWEKTRVLKGKAQLSLIG